MPHVEHLDHRTYPRRLRSKTEAELRFIIQDAGAAIAANPEGGKAGYYADEILYCQEELARRGLGRSA